MRSRPNSHTSRWEGFKKGAKDLYVDFVNTANPNSLNEDVSNKGQSALHSENRFECMDYHTPFPTIYLDHLRSSATYAGINKPDRSASMMGARTRSASGALLNNDSTTSNESSNGGEEAPGIRDSMRRVVKNMRSFNNSHKGYVILRWILHIVIALAVAVVAFSMLWGAESLYDWRYEISEEMVREKYKASPFGGNMVAWLVWTTTSVVCVAIAAGAIYFVPAAGGSGLPDVISFLNGVMRPKVVNLKTFFGKAISCCFCVGGGMPAGMEAPLIHIGAIVGAGVTQGRSRTLNCKTQLFQSLRTNKDRRDFITAGAACGVSAAFGAPIGGLLFIMEEVASFWDHNNSGQVFLATMTTFTMIAFLSGLKSDLLHNAYVLFEVDVKIDLNILAIIPAIFLGIICGLLASFFTKCNIMVTKWRRRCIKPFTLLRVIEPVLIALIYSSACYWIGVAGPCYETSPITDKAVSENIVVWGTENITALSQMGCNEETYNPLATLTFGSPKTVVRHMFTRRTVDEFPAGILIIYILLFFIASCYTSGSAVATGLVVPMLVNGATIGRLYGLIIVKGFSSSAGEHAYKYDQSWMDPGVYALIGAGAFFSGCTRMMISVCVIMVELAGDLHYLLPGMVAIVVSKVTADYFAKSLYHAQLHLDHIPFLPSHWDETAMEPYTAADVMSSPVVTLREQEYTSVVLDALKTTLHHAFPIVRTLEDGTEKFVGLVTRDDLQVYLALPELQVAETVTPTNQLDKGLLKDGSSAQREEPHRVIEDDARCPDDLKPENMPACVKEASRLTWGQWMAHQSSLFLKMSDRTWHEVWNNKLQNGGDGGTTAGSGAINVASLPPVVNLAIITNRSPYVVPPFFNLSLTYSMFRSVGLRHLIVLDGQTVVGIITRADLLNFTERGIREGSTAEFTAPVSQPFFRTRSRTLSQQATPNARALAVTAFQQSSSTTAPATPSDSVATQPQVAESARTASDTFSPIAMSSESPDTVTANSGAASRGDVLDSYFGN